MRIGPLNLAWAARFPRRGPSLLNNSHICQNFNNLRLRHFAQIPSQNFVHFAY